MGVLLQGFYKLNTMGVPCPADGDAAIPWWWDHLASQASDLRRAGFTAIWLPPCWKGALGARSLGYDLFDDYDLGSKDQKGSVPTRYGTREQLQRCVAIMRACGLDVYLDLVENQRIGGSGPGEFTFRYSDAFGNASGGKFEKDPLDFHPNVPQDPGVFGYPRMKEMIFGPDLAPINGIPPHHVFDGLIDSADWVTRALDVQGYRVDDVKGISTDFLLPLLDSKSMAGKFAMGEFFDGNEDLLRHWVFDPRGMRGRASAFDFPTRFLLAAMCNQPGHFNMALLDHAGLAGSDPFSAVTFVENHDTDTSPSLAPVVQNKMLAYAYILTSEGYPCVFYRDYSADRGCYDLKSLIDKLIWIHEKLASGTTQQRWKDLDVFAYERLGGPHLLVGLNNDPDNPRIITVDTGFGPHVTLRDYTGHADNSSTDENGRLTFTIPSNLDGLGYVAFSRDGVDGAFEIVPQSVRQVYEGARDLDIRPAVNGETIRVCRIWCEANTPITAELKFDSATLSPASSLTVRLVDPHDAIIGDWVFGGPNESNFRVYAMARTRGFHSFEIRLSGSQAGASKLPYALAVTYRASQGLD
jgi:alpha-amylase